MKTNKAKTNETIDENNPIKNNARPVVKQLVAVALEPELGQKIREIDDLEICDKNQQQIITRL